MDPMDDHVSFEKEQELLRVACEKKYVEYEQDWIARGYRFCVKKWDGASCWPATLAGYEAQLPCPAEYADILYDTRFNATRSCGANGTWAVLSVYDVCLNNTLQNVINYSESEDVVNLGILIIYFIGYVISFVSSCVALWLFIYFRTLHCLRNTLHCNLILTHMLVGISWILMTIKSVADGASEGRSVDYRFDCRVILALFVYFQLTNFFWMLVEGLYIILIIFRTHKLELLLYWPFALIGWGIPVIVTGIWIIVKLTFDDQQCWTNISSTYDFVFIGPILTVLAKTKTPRKILRMYPVRFSELQAINVIFLATIMYTLLRKYRGSTTAATSTRRTAKSFLILLPLLGLTYVCVLVLPEETGALKVSLNCFTAVSNSLQGFFVSLLYCFLNNEVRSIVRLRGNSFFPYRTWLKLDTTSRRSPRTFTTSGCNGPATVDCPRIVQQPPALFRYRQNENLRRLQINITTANKNEMAYLLKEKDHQDRIQKQMRHQAMGYRSTVF